MTERVERWFRQGEIWMAKIPRPDGMGMPRRPLIILSNNRFNAALQEVLVVPLTSKLPKHHFQFTYIIEDWGGTGLVRKSAIKPQVTAINKQLLTDRMGRLSDSTFAELQRQIATWF